MWIFVPTNSIKKSWWWRKIAVQTCNVFKYYIVCLVEIWRTFFYLLNATKYNHLNVNNLCYNPSICMKQEKELHPYALIFQYIINCTHPSSTWEADSCLVRQETPSLLWNPKVNNPFSENRWSILCWAGCIQFIPYSLKMHFNIIHHSNSSPKYSLRLKFGTRDSWYIWLRRHIWL
jgi:hypothetical protein